MPILGMVTLNRAFVSSAPNPSSYVEAGTAGSIGGGGNRDDNTTQEGSFRNYANFNTRLITGTAKNRTISVTMRALTPGQVANLRAWVGQTILFRDTYGRRIFGAYLTADLTDIPLSGKAGSTLLSDIAIQIQELVGYSEAV